MTTLSPHCSLNFEGIIRRPLASILCLNSPMNNIKEDGIYVDCTLGGAGHSCEILKRLTTGHLYCFDQDQTAIIAAKKRLDKIGDNYTIIYSNFVHKIWFQIST